MRQPVLVRNPPIQIGPDNIPKRERVPFGVLVEPILASDEPCSILPCLWCLELGDSRGMFFGLSAIGRSARGEIQARNDEIEKRRMRGVPAHRLG